MYQTASAEQARQPDGGTAGRPEPNEKETAGPAGGDSKVVDADFEVIDDDKNK